VIAANLEGHVPCQTLAYVLPLAAEALKVDAWTSNTGEPTRCAPQTSRRYEQSQPFSDPAMEGGRGLLYRSSPEGTRSRHPRSLPPRPPANVSDPPPE
jgi:hypothetical protein